jgi:hypothetical protein
MYYMGFEVPTDQAVDWMVQVSRPGQGKRYSSSPKYPDLIWICLMGTGFFSWGVKRPGCAVNHSYPCSAEVKNE